MTKLKRITHISNLNISYLNRFIFISYKSLKFAYIMHIINKCFYSYIYSVIENNVISK